MNHKTRLWLGTVVILIIASLLAWYLSENQPTLPLVEDSSTTETVTNTSGSGEVSVPGSNVTITKVIRSTQTVQTIVSSLSGASQFRSLFSSTGVSATVKSTGTYTIFVPTNGAFAQLSGGTISNLSTAEKKRLVQYHVITDRAVDVDAELAGSMRALSGDELNFSYAENKIPMVNSAIVITEYVGKNGIVYLIDNVLLPPKKAPGTL